uniref:NADH-ubiquinone oxidoreductase chain 6 n=1 Tax=Tricholoma saponaceum TaxID=113602 RepID=A0A6C0W7D1_9AGAR|nr:NADH dehydrogenase subunit 6 [Tricholoma saponaceum]QIC20281.1 NADH dehydrogenase subunit 6 [Tricholoma saponaceum]
MTILFLNILAFGTLFSSILSITSKNPVISVIFLITTFVQAALYLILMGINFVGISYIVIYVGAIAVLFLFIIMMINIKLTDILETGNQYTKNLPLAIAIGSLFIFIMFTILPFNFNNVPALSILLNNITYLNSILSDSNLISINLINSIVNNSLFSSVSDVLIIEFQQIEVLGHGLYTYEAVLLIILSVILLLAMFATIIISRTNKAI